MCCVNSQQPPCIKHVGYDCQLASCANLSIHWALWRFVVLQALTSTVDGDIVVWDEQGQSAHMGTRATDRRAIKVMRLHGSAILHLSSIGDLVVTGEVKSWHSRDVCDDQTSVNVKSACVGSGCKWPQ